MKTSNIIILSTIGIIISLNFWMAVDGGNKFKNVVNQDIETTEENTIIETKLNKFSHIVVAENIHLNLKSSRESTKLSASSKSYSKKIVGDTLYLSGDAYLTLKCDSIKSIELKDESKLNTKQFESAYLFIKTFDNTKVFLHNVNISKLEIYSQNNSRIILTQSEIDTTNILASENSRIGLVGSLDVVRGEVKDNSNLSVTGANNTQFSKSGNAKINLH